MFIRQDDTAALPVYLRPAVISLNENARVTLETLGAIIEEADFPSSRTTRSRQQ
jgi:hypothetical protein